MKVKPDPFSKVLIRIDYFLNRLWKYRFNCSWSHKWKEAGELADACWFEQ